MYRFGCPSTPGHAGPPPASSIPLAGPVSPVTGFDWNLFEATEDPESIPFTELRQGVCQELLDFLDREEDSEEELLDEVGEIPEGHRDADSLDEHGSAAPPPRKRARTNFDDPKQSEDWYPWEDRITCSLDILMHLPRSVFSEKQLDLFLWILRVNEVRDVPSIKTMKALNKAIQNMCGVDTISCNGKLGHNYSMTNLSQILSQEMCNPKVRPHLHFYPEDTGKTVEEAYHAAKWLHDMNSEMTTPMVRHNGEDYYIFEPTMLKDGSCCIPFRWFEREGHMFASAWALENGRSENGVPGWFVRKDRERTIFDDQLLKNFPILSRDCERYGIPHPSRILGVRVGTEPGKNEPWTHTNPVEGNRWRSLAQGYRTLCLPLWLYCDDTSGNMSKKWNAHNSYLFTLAGLPRKHIAQEYNIHFLCTSNIATPLEMMEGVVDQIKSAQQNGIWAWDIQFNEPVLIFPAVLALLGDNPMQSEFACHIGMCGKFFCRTCWVKGSDANESDRGKSSLDSNHAAELVNPLNSPVASENGSATGCNDDETNVEGTSKRTVHESMDTMVHRISAFMEVGRLRNKEETQKILQSYLQHASVIGSKTKLKNEHTNTGIKDNYQEFFLDKLLTSYSSKIGPSEKQLALEQALDNLPDNITSPVWKLKELDPHQDTPVEVLHVVLLGFVKYFWRDLTKNQLTTDQAKLLIQRLNSFDVSGLGISPLAGHTLVRYAGSLTGRDFRTISQVAPFVIYDLVPPHVFNAWLAMSKLVPLIYQPKIEDIDAYLAVLKLEIDAFLLKTAEWTCAWFNKKKFHVLLHLVENVRRFGPAIIFATEAFESFNAVIRAKSIHSNRQAPSQDIAVGFAQGNRIRHLLSRGRFLEDRHQDICSVCPSDWHTIGPGPAQIFSSDSVVPSYLGTKVFNDINPGSGQWQIHQGPPRPIVQTLTGTWVPGAIMPERQNCLFQTCKQLTLDNGDICKPGQYVIVSANSGLLFVACVHEILVRAHSDMRPEGMLVQKASTNEVSETFQMPRLTLLENEWFFVAVSNILCTVNAPHDCARHGCTTSGLRYALQERAVTTQEICVVEHVQPLGDRILNIAQMRNATHLQSFRIPSRPINDKSLCIHQAVSHTIAQRKQASMPAGRGGRGGRARGRGRGGGIAARRSVPTPSSASMTTVASTMPSTLLTAPGTPPTFPSTLTAPGTPPTYEAFWESMRTRPYSPVPDHTP